MQWYSGEHAAVCSVLAMCSCIVPCTLVFLVIMSLGSGRSGIRSEARYIVSNDASASQGVGYITDLAFGASFSAPAACIGSQLVHPLCLYLVHCVALLLRVVSAACGSCIWSSWLSSQVAS